jgi:hypothetical protein
MTTLLLRYHVAEKDAQTLVGAIETAFAGLEKQRPAGLRFTYYRVGQTAEFVGLVELDDGFGNPLPELEATRTLKTVVDSVALGSPPVPQQLQVLARYGS